MGAGKYNQRVTFQASTRTKDAAGSLVDIWANVATVWGSVKTITGRERWASEHTAHNYDVALLIRYRTDLTESMRTLYNGRTLEVATLIDVDDRRRELAVLCKEIRNE